MTATVIQNVVMPKWGLSMETGTIVEWLVGEGEEVSKGQDLVEIETEKSAGPVESMHEGIVRRHVAQPGEEVPIGATIALLAPLSTTDDELDAAVASARAAMATVDADRAQAARLRAVEVGTSSYAVTEVGDEAADEVVVLVHGFGGDARSWQFVQGQVAMGRRVCAIDLPGHGSSAKDVGDGTIDSMAATIVGILDALGVGAAHLVGHSLGGALCVRAAATKPAAVRSLTLVAPAGFGSRPNAGYLRGFASATTRRELRPLLLELFATERFVTAQMVQDVLRYKRLDGVDRALAAVVEGLLEDERQAIDVRPDLEGLDVPTIIVWGAQDRILPMPENDMLRALADLRVIERIGHMPHIECPTEVIAAVEEAVSAG